MSVHVHIVCFMSVNVMGQWSEMCADKSQGNEKSRFLRLTNENRVQEQCRNIEATKCYCYHLY